VAQEAQVLQPSNTPKSALVQQIAKRRLGNAPAIPTVSTAPVTPPAMQGVFPNADSTMQETLKRIAGLRTTLGIQ
jgi:hypothetical protein